MHAATIHKIEPQRERKGKVLNLNNSIFSKIYNISMNSSSNSILIILHYRIHIPFHWPFYIMILWWKKKKKWNKLKRCKSLIGSLLFTFLLYVESCVSTCKDESQRLVSLFSIFQVEKSKSPWLHFHASEFFAYYSPHACESSLKQS